jgi:AP-3 complex subunit mu
VIDAGRHFFIHIQRGGLFFLAVIQDETAPLYVLDLLERIHAVFLDYFGKVTVSTLKAHFTVVYQLLDEMVDYGVPFTTEPNILRDIVTPPSVINALAGSVLGQSGVASGLPSAAVSEVDWRRRDVKYRTNEMFVDVIETVHCIMEANGQMISADVYGVFECECLLSGMPDLTLFFNRPELMDDVSFHRCVRHKVWEKSKNISFIPPDGKFKLLTFRAKGNIQLPLTIDPKVKFTPGNGTVTVRVTPRDVSQKPLADVKVELRFPKSISTATLMADAGRVVYDEATKVCTWDIGTMKPSVTVELSGTVLLPPGQECDPPTMFVSFSQLGWTPTGLKVTELRVSRETYSAFKGVRSIAKADRTVEIRL